MRARTSSPCASAVRNSSTALPGSSRSRYCVQAFLEDHRLVVAGRVGEFQNAHPVAGLGAPLGARHDGAGDAARGRALLHRIGERRPRLHVQPLERGGVIVERMAGEEEADRVELALQPLGRQPRLGRGQRNLLAHRRPAEHVVLADLRSLVLALRRRKDRVDAGVDARAVGLQRIERAGGGEAFQHALVDRARIDAAREVRDVAERLVAARLDDRLDRLPPDAFQRGERVMDRAALDVEIDAGAVDRRRLDLDAEPLRLGAEFRQLVGIAPCRRSSTRRGTRPDSSPSCRRSGRRRSA